MYLDRENGGGDRPDAGSMTTSVGDREHRVHFDTSHHYGGPRFYKVIKHEQPGNGFWPTIRITLLHQTFVGKMTVWTY